MEEGCKSGSGSNPRPATGAGKICGSSGICGRSFRSSVFLLWVETTFSCGSHSCPGSPDGSGEPSLRGVGCASSGISLHAGTARCIIAGQSDGCGNSCSALRYASALHSGRRIHCANQLGLPSQGTGPSQGGRLPGGFPFWRSGQPERLPHHGESLVFTHRRTGPADANTRSTS